MANKQPSVIWVAAGNGNVTYGKKYHTEAHIGEYNMRMIENPDMNTIHALGLTLCSWCERKAMHNTPRNQTERVLMEVFGSLSLAIELLNDVQELGYSVQIVRNKK